MRFVQQVTEYTIGMQSYFITNDVPLPFWDFISLIVGGLGYKAPTWHLPYWLVYLFALIVQFFSTLLCPLATINPTFSPMRVALAGTHQYYSSARAKKDFGYKPVVEFDDVVSRTLEYFSYLKNKGA